MADDDERAAQKARIRAETRLSQEAIRSRLSLLRHLDDPEHGTKIALELMDVTPWDATPVLLKNAQLIRQQLTTMVESAVTFPSTNDICELLSDAGMRYPGETLTVRDIITPTGMAFFETPIVDPTGQYDSVPIRALSWSVARGDDPAIRFLDASADSLMLTLIVYCDTRSMPYPGDPSRLIGEKELQGYPRIYPAAAIVWEVGIKGGGLHWDEDVDGQERRWRLPYIRTLLAWWAVMRQRLTVTEDVTVKPHPREIERAQRRAKARGMTRVLNTDIKMVRMRPRKRTRYTEYSGFNRANYQEGFWVIAHWREDWRARQRGEDDKFQLVSPYPKGPELNPERGREKTYLPPLAPKDQR